MNQGLPKPIQEALARQMAGDAHPSADSLTAFVERSLPQLESQRVTDHLAQCADCREVVFLANSAVEEPVGEEQELMPADAVARISPALLAKAQSSEVAAEASRRHGWRLRWVWLTAVAAVLVVSGVAFLKRSEFGRPGPMVVVNERPPVAALPPEMTAVVHAPGAETKVAPESKPVPAPPKPPAKSARVQTNEVRKAETLAKSEIASNVPEQYSSASALPFAPQPGSPPPPNALGGAVKAPATTHNTFVESEGQATTALSFARPTPSMEKPQMAMRSISGLGIHWRVTADGRLERSTTPGNWAPVLADQPIRFHVVSVVGNNVWAGGSGGTLFHSSDGGQNWSKQPLAGETGTIVSIRFSDAAHGAVNTEGGARWSTSDGGLTWAKE